MIAILLAFSVQSSGPGLVEAERHFAALAQEIGQWRAFEQTAASDAVILTPEPVRALDWLKGRKDPPKSANWQPAAAYLSCDRSTGATIGPWQRPSSVGYFATVWSRESGEWRWKVDMGDALKSSWAIPKGRIKIRRASCSKANATLLPKISDVGRHADGSSPDRSLVWRWEADEGRTRIVVFLWNGRSYDAVIDKVIGK